MSDCRIELVHAGKPSPRTCRTCGISGSCAKGLTLAIPLRPDEVTSLINIDDGPDFARAVNAINSGMRQSTPEADGFWVPGRLLGPTARVRSRVIAHFKAAGWAIEAVPGPQTESIYVFKPQ